MSEDQTKQTASPRTIAENIIADYGKAAFKKLINMFQARESGTKIGYVFDVSRQRVHQWKTALGQEQMTYVVNTEIMDLVDAPKRRGMRRTLV